MPYKWECSIEKQDCTTLYNPRPNYKGYKKLGFTTSSCVRDRRLEGNVGRCGFPGAPCVIDSKGNDNCAGGGDGTFWDYTSVCWEGFCHGTAGANCYGDVECNWGLRCNGTGYQQHGYCGGAWAKMESGEGADGLDFAKDYCWSGRAFQQDGTWYCSGDPPMTLAEAPAVTVAPKKKLSTTERGLIAALAIVVVLAFLLVGWCWLRGRQRRHRASKEITPSKTEIDEIESREKVDLASRSPQAKFLDAGARASTLDGMSSASYMGSGTGTLPHGMAPLYGDDGSALGYSTANMLPNQMIQSSQLPEIQSDVNAGQGGLRSSEYAPAPPRTVIPLKSWNDLPVGSGHGSTSTFPQEASTIAPAPQVAGFVDRKERGDVQFYPSTIRGQLGSGGIVTPSATNAQPPTINSQAPNSNQFMQPTSTYSYVNPSLNTGPDRSGAQGGFAAAPPSTSTSTSTSPAPPPLSMSATGGSSASVPQAGGGDTEAGRRRKILEEAERSLAAIRSEMKALDSSSQSG